jgi:hypothetical protein
LTISGKTSNGAPVAFTRSQLEALGSTTLVTTTPWHTGPMTFEGIPMKTLMEKVGASGTKIIATALNKYSAEIPVTDFSQFDVLLAYKRDGNYMTVRDNGPLFIVYPFDRDVQLKSETFYNRSAWQVHSMTIE